MIAKASGSGVWETSAPRMLNVQATACGSETTSASALSFLISARMRSSFCAAGSPANCRSCGTIAPWGGARRLVDEMLDREQLGVGLVAGLERITAVDEQHRALGEDDGGAGRSGKAGEPGEPLFARRQIFVLEAIRVGHHEPFKPAARQLRPQRNESRHRLRRLLGIVEGLELSVKIFQSRILSGVIRGAGSRPRVGIRVVMK